MGGCNHADHLSALQLGMNQTASKPQKMETTKQLPLSMRKSLNINVQFIVQSHFKEIHNHWLQNRHKKMAKVVELS